jgi:hypothetical protein
MREANGPRAVNCLLNRIEAGAVSVHPWQASLPETSFGGLLDGSARSRIETPDPVLSPGRATRYRCCFRLLKR